MTNLVVGTTGISPVNITGSSPSSQTTTQPTFTNIPQSANRLQRFANEQVSQGQDIAVVQQSIDTATTALASLRQSYESDSFVTITNLDCEGDDKRLAEQMTYLLSNAEQSVSKQIIIAHPNQKTKPNHDGLVDASADYESIKNHILNLGAQVKSETSFGTHGQKMTEFDNGMVLLPGVCVKREEFDRNPEVNTAALQELKAKTLEIIGEKEYGVLGATSALFTNQLADGKLPAFYAESATIGGNVAKNLKDIHDIEIKGANADFALQDHEELSQKLRNNDIPFIYVSTMFGRLPERTVRRDLPTISVSEASQKSYDADALFATKKSLEWHMQKFGLEAIARKLCEKPEKVMENGEKDYPKQQFSDCRDWLESLLGKDLVTAHEKTFEDAFSGGIRIGKKTTFREIDTPTTQYDFEDGFGRLGDLTESALAPLNSLTTDPALSVLVSTGEEIGGICIAPPVKLQGKEERPLVQAQPGNDILITDLPSEQLLERIGGINEDVKHVPADQGGVPALSRQTWNTLNTRKELLQALGGAMKPQAIKTELPTQKEKEDFASYQRLENLSSFPFWVSHQEVGQQYH